MIDTLSSVYEPLYKQVLQKKGKFNQVVVAIEELSELAKELTKDLRGKGNIDHIIEEMGDVLIVVDELKMIYDISDHDILVAKNLKLDRLSMRLKEKCE